MKIPRENFLKDDLDHHIHRVETMIHQHVEKESGILKLGFAPRLLETILLASYHELYSLNPSSTETRAARRFQMEHVLEAVKRETLDPLIFPFIDLNIQNLLLTVYQNTSSDDVIHWFLLYNSLLQVLFSKDSLENQLRKLLGFNLIALFSTADLDIREQLLDSLLSIGDFLETDSSFSAQVETKIMNFEEHPPWHQLYHVIFFFLWFHLKNKIFGKKDAPIEENTKIKIKNLLSYLQRLQDVDGSWQKNNLLTLLLLHVMRFCKIQDSFPNQVMPMIQKAEQYLHQYTTTGLSVLPSQELYNTALFFGMRFYFTGKKPPKNTVESLLKAQHDDGGIKFHQDIAFSDFDTTGFAILTMLARWLETKDPRIEKSLSRCVAYTWKIRKPDGSFPLYASAKESLPEMTARAVMVSAILPPIFIDDDARRTIISDGLKNLVNLQNSDGSFDYTAYSASMLYPISQAALAHHFVSQSPFIDASDYFEPLNILKRRMLRYLTRYQNVDGSYNSIPFKMSFGEQQSTSYAILSWALLQPHSPEHLKALNWLSRFTEKGIRSFPEGTGPRPIRYNDLSHGPIFACLSYMSTRFTNSPRGIEILTKHIH